MKARFSRNIYQRETEKMKLSIAFFAGVLTMAAVVYMTGAHFAAPMFFAGLVAALAPAVVLLSSIKRVRSVARFLNAFADSWGGMEVRPRLVRSRAEERELSGYVKPSSKQQGRILEDTISEYLGDEDIFAPPPTSARRAS